VLNQLQGKEEVITNLKNKFKARASFVFVLKQEVVPQNYFIKVPEQLIKFCEIIGAEISFDTYFDEYLERN
jgi:hypothetical protein